MKRFEPHRLSRYSDTVRPGTHCFAQVGIRAGLPRSGGAKDRAVADGAFESVVALRIGKVWHGKPLNRPF